MDWSQAAVWGDGRKRRRRPNRTAAERRAQMRRAEARTIQRLLASFASLAHRGSAPTQLGAALASALARGAETEPNVVEQVHAARAGLRPEVQEHLAAIRRCDVVEQIHAARAGLRTEVQVEEQIQAARARLSPESREHLAAIRQRREEAMDGRLRGRAAAAVFGLEAAPGEYLLDGYLRQPRRQGATTPRRCRCRTEPNMT